jgi:hypothetical protein
VPNVLGCPDQDTYGVELRGLIDFFDTAHATPASNPNYQYQVILFCKCTKTGGVPERQRPTHDGGRCSVIGRVDRHVWIAGLYLYVRPILGPLKPHGLTLHVPLLHVEPAGQSESPLEALHAYVQYEPLGVTEHRPPTGHA